MTEAQSIDIGRALRILLANGWILILTIGAAAGGVYAWDSHQHKVYQSTALVTPVDTANPTDTSTGGRQDAQLVADTQVLYAKSPDFKADFSRRMGPAVRQIRSTSVSATTTANALSIAVTSESKALAQRGASTYAQTYIDRQRAAVSRAFAGQASQLRSRAKAVQKQLDVLNAQIAALQPSGGTRIVMQDGKPVVVPPTEQVKNLSLQVNTLGHKYADLLDSAQQSDATGISQQAAIDFVQRPALPTNPVSPLPRRDAAVGALAGLILGLLLVLLRIRLRARLTTSQDVKTAMPQIPFVTAIPSHGSGKGGRRAKIELIPDDDWRAAESYRTLRTWLRVAGAPGQPIAVLITSALAAEGKTTVTANLGVSLAQAGESVLLVDCDLRHPNIHALFDTANAIGVTSLVMGSATLDEAIQHVSIPGGSVDVLPAGQLTGSPAEILASREARDLFAQLRTRYDYVLVDSSPVLPVADALTLSQSVDQVLLVVRARRTRMAAFREAGNLLRQFGAPLRAAVLVGARHERTRGGYEYGVAAGTDGARNRSGTAIPGQALTAANGSHPANVNHQGNSLVGRPDE